MKNCYVAMRRVRDEEGNLSRASEDKADAGTFYLEEHPHPAVKGKEFTSVNEGIQAIVDHQNLNKDRSLLLQAGEMAKAGDSAGAIALISATSAPKIGEVIFLNVLEF